MNLDKKDLETMAMMSTYPASLKFIQILERLSAEADEHLREATDTEDMLRWQGRSQDRKELLDIVKNARNRLNST